MDRYNVKGLKAICGANRDIVSSYNHLFRDELIDLLNKNKDIIVIPSYISNNIEYINLNTYRRGQKII